MRILFVGDLNTYGRSFQRSRILADMGHEVTAISTVPVPRIAGIDPIPFFEIIRRRLRIPADPTDANQQIRRTVSKQSFDLIWIEKGITIRPRTLVHIRKALPQAPIISLSEDDMYARHNNTYYYIKCLPLYDIVFTTKTYNLTELKQLGARRVEHFMDAYNEKLHHPVALTDLDKAKYQCDIGFIGTFEQDRADSLLYLAEHGIAVTVWGNGWASMIDTHKNLIIKNEPVYDDEYVKAINATKINLGFLRKINRDQITSRSVEIPACGGFLLAERTQRHQGAFEEGREAEFFSTNEEMLDKVKKYLANETARNTLARLGRQRCIDSNYSMKDQLNLVITAITHRHRQ